MCPTTTSSPERLVHVVRDAPTRDSGARVADHHVADVSPDEPFDVPQVAQTPEPFGAQGVLPEGVRTDLCAQASLRTDGELLDLERGSQDKFLVRGPVQSALSVQRRVGLSCHCPSLKIRGERVCSCGSSTLIATPTVVYLSGMLTALVTGGTSGLGAAFARSLARKGFNLILVARNENRLREVSEQLAGEHGIHVDVMAADLSDRHDVERVAQRLADTSQPVDLLINNAGFSVGTPFLTDDFSPHDAGMDVMCRAVALLSGAAGRSMTQRGTGWIVNIASVAGCVTMGEYSSIKAYVTSMTESLAVELHGTGVQATAVLPGWVRTEFHSRAGIAGSSIPNFMWLTADVVADKALADVARGKVLSIPAVRYKAVYTALRHLPRPAVRWISRQVSGARKREKEA